VKIAGLLVVLVMLLEDPVCRADEPSTETAKTIAVLDFVNRNPADGRDWLGKGLADMVITDLSASKRLSAIDRQRVQELSREIELGEAGVLDPKTAPQVGKIARVQWILFGTFSYHEGAVSLETLLIDVNAEQTMRIEQIAGPADKLFDLEQSLVYAILAKLGTPMTDEELHSVKLLKTQSLPAFEHYARSLHLFDQGQWFEALREARLARRADPAYFPAAVQLAQLFYDVGEPEHAVIEYRRFVEQDRGDSLPAGVYLALGKILEQTFADRTGAISVFQRLLRRNSEFDQPFRITDPSRPSHDSNNVGGSTAGYALFQEHKASLEALERLARWQLEAGEQADAARLYGQLWHWLNTHGMPYGWGEAGGFLSKLLGNYRPLYCQLVLENRDATFYPPCALHLLSAENAAVDASTAPTHGSPQWQHGQVWLAPPDRELAEVSYALEDDGSEAIKQLGGKVQIDFTCMGFPSILWKMPQVKPDGTWHTLKFKPGIRALQTYVFTSRWQMKFTLRAWSQPAKVPEAGSFQVNFLPPSAEMFFNGKSHGRVEQGLAFVNEPPKHYEVEVRWPDGRRRSGAFDIINGKRGGMLLNADLNTISRQVLAPDGSNTCLLTDRTGRIWLLWDQACLDDMMQLNLESNLFCANSSDGVTWSRPRRLPVSSLDCDTMPILRQDRRGVFWLVWVSSRDPKAPKSLWIASSPNGVEWSFPKKIVLPETEKSDLARWRETKLPRPAFAIDGRNIFWLVWQGWLMRSEDAATWQVDSLLQTSEKEFGADNSNSGKGYHLLCAPDGLLLAASYFSREASEMNSMLWRRNNAGKWDRLDFLSKGTNITQHAGSAAIAGDGTILTIAQGNSGLFVREFFADGSKSEPLCVESYLTRPFHPSVTPLPEGRFLVAFASKDGLVVTVLQKDQPKMRKTDR
jgi:TolB-like protein